MFHEVFYEFQPMTFSELFNLHFSLSLGLITVILAKLL